MNPSSIKVFSGKMRQVSVFLIMSIYLFGCFGCGDSGGGHHFKNRNGGGNDIPTIQMFCPTTIGEMTATICSIDASDTNRANILTCSLNAATTCTGVTLTDCVLAEIPAQGEAAGPGSCDVAVDVKDNADPPTSVQGSFTFTIEEENQDPSVGVACPANVGEDTATSCALTVTDGDLPAQTLTCSLNPLSTCAGATITDCQTVDIPAQGEGALPTCSIVVDVDDGFTPLGTGMGSDDILIDEVNQNPTISVDCPANVSENNGAVCALTALDGDLPAQTLTCAVNIASTTCTGVTLTGCSAANVPAQGEAAPATCSVVVDVQDDFGTPGTGQGTDTIAIDEVNQNPTITVNCPASVDETAATTCPLTVADADLPAQTLTCSLNPATTCTGVTLTGCTQANVPAQGESALTPCTVVVNVQDGFGTPGTAVGSDSMTINEVNQNPTITVDCPASVNEDTGTNCVLTAADADLPPQTLTCAVNIASTTCTGVTLTGCALANVPAQGESAPSSCSVTVDVQDSFGVPGTGQGTDTMVINETNQNPAVTVTCPSDMDESDSVTCGLAPSDADVPAQSLTCTISALTSCTGATIESCNTVDVPAQGEHSGDSCSVVVNVQDDFSTPGTGQGSSTISITRTNSNPTVSLSCPESVAEIATAECVISATDPDWPPQTLSCYVNMSLTTCGNVSMDGSDCDVVYVAPQGEAEGPGTCTVVVDVEDEFSATDTGSDILKIEESNQPPYWYYPPPDNIVVEYDTAYNTNIRAADDDSPSSIPSAPGYLTCSKVSSNCVFFWPTVSGSGAGSVDCEVSFDSPDGPQQCELTIEVSDGMGASIEKTIKITTTDIWYVDATMSVLGDGYSWGTAFQTVHEAEDAASDGDAVFVADGDYTNSVDDEAVLYLESDVMWFGGFEGGWEVSTSDRAQPISNNSYPSVLNADDGYNHSCHVVVGSEIENAVLDGFKITGGFAIGGEYSDCGFLGGGGIYNDMVLNSQFNNLVIYNNISYNADPGFPYSPPLPPLADWDGGGGGIKNIESFNLSLKNNVLYENYTYGNDYAGGGGILNLLTVAYLYNNTFYDNKAWGLGGGLLGEFSNQVINSSYFDNNHSYTGGGAIASTISFVPFGPGYYFETRISDSIFKYNESYYGGAILNIFGDLDISNSDIVYNRAIYYDGFGGYGGGVVNVYNSGPPYSLYLTIRDSNVVDNYAYYSGGGIVNKYGQSIIYNSIISGNEADEGSGGGMYNEDSFVYLINSEITYNRADNDYGNGGGMYNYDSGIYLMNVSVSNNDAGDEGGGMSNVYSGIYIDNSRIDDNYLINGESYGGGMFNYRSKIYMDNSSLSGNYNEDEGGGMFNSHSDTHIGNSILNDNYSGCDGGAVYDEAGTIGIYNSIISDNFADDNGGGVYANYGSQLTIHDSIISNNYSYSDEYVSGGGVAVLYGAQADIRYTVFQNNQAYYSGGAIALYDYAIATIENSLFFGNRAGYYWDEGYGGAVDVVDYSDAYITNCTFSGNMAEYGGAIAAYDYGYVLISNSILWGDVASGAYPEIAEGGDSYVNVDYSNLTNSYPGTGNISNDPLFVNAPRMWDYTTGFTGFDNTIEVNDASRYFVNEIIEINMDSVARVVLDATGNIVTFAPSLINPFGGGTLVQDWGAAPLSIEEDFYLQSGSPSRDTGTNAGAPSEDLRHNFRPANYITDMGAYEYQVP